MNRAESEEGWPVGRWIAKFQAADLRRKSIREDLPNVHRTPGQESDMNIKVDENSVFISTDLLVHPPLTSAGVFIYSRAAL